MIIISIIYSPIKMCSIPMCIQMEFVFSVRVCMRVQIETKQ